MSKENNGGPAFPHMARPVGPVNSGAGGCGGIYYENLTHGGMTLRDYFAAKAMQSIVSSPNEMADLIDTLGAPTAYAKVSETAYVIADAMLSAREAS